MYSPKEQLMDSLWDLNICATINVKEFDTVDRMYSPFKVLLEELCDNSYFLCEELSIMIHNQIYNIDCENSVDEFSIEFHNRFEKLIQELSLIRRFQGCEYYAEKINEITEIIHNE